MIKTSEAMMIGHPDKICDQIADAILEEINHQDKESRVAIECLIKNSLIVIAGEVTTKAIVNYQDVARSVLKNIGYNEHEYTIIVEISTQSTDISIGVDKGGAGDQGIMYGYACNESEECLPLPIVLARKLALNLDKISILYPEFFGLDGKCQISINYEKDQPKEITCIVISIQTKQGIKKSKYEYLIHRTISMAIPKHLINNQTKILINPTGEFIKGGPYADTGLTGRKLQSDGYGGLALHGGGAWSGKDFSKVDRGATYFARYIAKNIVVAGLAQKCEIGIAYAIGIEEPISVSLNTFSTSSKSDYDLLEIIKKVFDFRPKTIKETFKSFNNFYLLSQYGHIGINNELPWELTDKIEALQKLANAN